jgi:hypothetical protein
MANTLVNYNIKINEIKTDSPYINIVSKDTEKPRIIRPDRRVSFEIQYIPTEVGSVQSHIFFLIEI